MIDQSKIDKSTASKKAQIMQKTPEKAHIEQKALEEALIEQETPKEAQVPENYEISVSYVHTKEKWDRNNIIINNIFAFQVTYDIIRIYEDPEPRNMK